MITIIPRSPSTTDAVSISYGWSGCPIGGGMTRNGTLFDIYNDYSSTCFAAPPGGDRVIDVGVLPAGTYSVIVHSQLDGQPSYEESMSFVVGGSVQPVAAPASSAASLVALAAALVICVALRRSRPCLRK